jgi:hypothetical protein
MSSVGVVSVGRARAFYVVPESGQSEQLRKAELIEDL